VTLARPEAPHTLVPEARGPSSAGQTGPYTMTGQAWDTDVAARPKARNGFAITLTGARAVRLNLKRMGVTTRRRAFGRVQTDSRLRLRLTSRSSPPTRATLDGRPVKTKRTPRRTTVTVPPGKHRLVLHRAG